MPVAETVAAPAPRADVDAGARARARAFAIGLVVIAVFALAVRIAFVTIVDPSVPRIGDASAYHLLANNLADGRGYIRPFDDLLLGKVRATAEYPPLFAAVLAVPAKLGAHSVESQRLFLAFVGAVTVVLVGLLGRRVGGRTVGLVAAFLAACYPMLFLSEGIAMSEALYVPLIALALLLTYQLIDAPSAWRAVLLGVVLGLATLTRAEAALLAVVLVIGLCWRLRAQRWSERLAFSAIVLVLVALVVTPWTIRNEAKLHAFVPVSNNVATLIDGANCKLVYHGSDIGLWRATFRDNGSTNTARHQPQSVACFQGFDIQAANFDEATVADQHRHEGLTYARDHAGALPPVVGARVLRTWGLYAPRQQVAFESLEGRPRHWQWAGTVMFWVLLPFAIAGVVLLVRRKVPVWPLIATAVTVTLTAAATYGQQRFRVAAEPAVLVAAAVAMVWVLRRIGVQRAVVRMVPGTPRSDR
jgi:4-amino-4-deoxy-L-arabinose transferase-like glycosyltransferase